MRGCEERRPLGTDIESECQEYLSASGLQTTANTGLADTTTKNRSQFISTYVDQSAVHYQKLQYRHIKNMYIQHSTNNTTEFKDSCKQEGKDSL